MQVKPFDVTVNILYTVCYNTNLGSILITKVKIQNSVKTEKKQVAFVLLNAIYMHPVKWI